MTSVVNRLTSCLLILVAGLSVPALAEAYGRAYSLNTLDARVAEVLVWDICEEIAKKAEHCEVQVAQGHQLVALAPREVHARIVRMLLERDGRDFESQGFQIALVRAAAGRKIKAIAQPNLQRALAAVAELFPHTLFEIVDQGMIRTADRGTIRLGDPETGLYEAYVRRRAVVSGLEGRELTVELELKYLDPEGGSKQALSSVLTVAVGETVVAGSSRMGSGEEAVLVLVTAVDNGR